MEIDPTTLTAKQAYHTLISCVIPRPIAWIATENTKGLVNLAPFSFFGGVTTDPMTVMVSIGRRRGLPKDTTRNLIATSEGVIHIATRPLHDAMVRTAADEGPDVSEVPLAGLTTTPSQEVRPPRITEAAIAMEATVQQHLQVGNGPVDVFLLEIVHLHIADDMIVDGLPDPARLRAIGRLGGSGYCDTSIVYESPRT